MKVEKILSLLKVQFGGERRMNLCGIYLSGVGGGSAHVGLRADDGLFFLFWFFLFW